MNISSFLKYILAFILFFIMPSCAKKANIKEKTAYQIPSISLNKSYNIFINDVECDLCAQSVINALRGLPGVCNITYEMVNGAYDEGYVKLYLDSNIILDQSLVKQKLKELDFEVKSIVENRAEGDSIVPFL